jgi:hypothetical protein
MLITFSHVHEVLYANVRGLPECTESRGRYGEDGVDPERWKKTELAMAEGLTKLTKKLGEAEIDSVDSLICAYEFRMRMGDLH